MVDEPLPELLQCPLREGRLILSQPVEHQLPTLVHHRQLDSLRVGHSQVPLDDERHAQERGRDWLVTRSGLAIHLLQLFLERAIEEFVPLQAQESEQLPRSLQPLDDEFFSLAQLFLRIPMFHASSPSPPTPTAKGRSRSRPDLFVDPPAPRDRIYMGFYPIGALGASVRAFEIAAARDTDEAFGAPD